MSEMELIPKSDPQYFEQSSYELYDRHLYQLDFQEGKSLIFDDYEQLRVFWFEQIRNWHGCVVTVLDKDAKKESGSTKGFGN